MELGERAFFIGPNASGKSNLLDALRFVRDIASLDGGFQSAVKRRGGVGEIRTFAASRNPYIRLEFALGDDDRPEQWKYAIEFTAVATKDRAPILRSEVVSGSTGKLLNRPDPDDKKDPMRLSQTALEQVNANSSFRAVAEFFSSIRYLHVVPQIVRDPGRSGGKDDPFGGDLIERINSTAKKTRNARLKRMEEALRIAVPQMRDLELEVDERGVPHLRAKYEHWRPNAGWQRENRFSDGTLRLLGLIWSLQETGGPFLLEEPEMSLNPAVVSRIAPIIAKAARRSRRQSLITTHSVDLLSDGVDLSEVYLLFPSPQGTDVIRGFEMKDVHALIEGGTPLGEAILPKTKAAQADRLPSLDLFAS
jgi:predicted ATPase